ncbi:MAG: hypothetical protein GEU79_16875 [Acidimicrobiia bacterium]|nr:hypothetical protein [Acidimicrobiia bacterium]
MEAVSSYITDLGAAVALPFIIFVFALILQQGVGDSIRAGLKIGIGFVGINLIIGLLAGAVAPAAEAMAENFGIELTVLDVGWPASAAIAFGTQVGALAIPVGLLINVIMLAVGLTRTLDIDLWNYWHIAFSGALVAVVTGSTAAGIFAAAIHMVILLAMADWSQPLIESYFGYENVSLPHGTSAPYAVFAIPMNAVFEGIPGLRDWKADPESIQQRFGVLGESTVLGAVLGLIIGLLGYGFDDPRADSIAILTLAINLAAAMYILPKMVAILMEALIPISEGAQKLVRKRFPDRTVYIGLDSAIAIGAPAVIAVSLLLVPITLALAVILPGNRVLPLVDLATIPFIVCIMVPIFKGNLIRSLIGGTIAMAVTLYISTGMAALVTEVAASVNFESAQGATEISSLVDGGNPLSGLIVLAGRMGWVGLVILALAGIAFAYVIMTRITRKRELAETPAE